MRCRARQVFGGNGKRVLACMLEDLSAFASVAETGIHHQPAQLFAESEVITLINEGVELPDIAAGIHEATAGRLHALGEKGGGGIGRQNLPHFSNRD